MRTKFFRRKFLAARQTQFKYLILLVVSMVIPSVFVGGCLYYIIFTLLAERLGIPESIAYNLYPVIKEMNYILVIGVPFLFLVLIGWGMVISHRFVGPLERLEREIKKISKEGDYTSRIKVRRDDDIKPVADAINLLLSKIEGKMK